MQADGSGARIASCTGWNGVSPGAEGVSYDIAIDIPEIRGVSSLQGQVARLRACRTKKREVPVLQLRPGKVSRLWGNPEGPDQILQSAMSIVLIDATLGGPVPDLPACTQNTRAAEQCPLFTAEWMFPLGSGGFLTSYSYRYRSRLWQVESNRMYRIENHH